MHARTEEEDDPFSQRPRARIAGQLVRSITQERAHKHGLNTEQVSDVLQFCEVR